MALKLPKISFLHRKCFIFSQLVFFRYLKEAYRFALPVSTILIGVQGSLGW